jgi:hypothetical protein
LLDLSVTQDLAFTGRHLLLGWEAARVAGSPLVSLAWFEGLEAVGVLLASGVRPGLPLRLVLAGLGVQVGPRFVADLVVVSGNAGLRQSVVLWGQLSLIGSFTQVHSGACIQQRLLLKVQLLAL